ncbi:MAG: hypothetical protein KBT28_01645 [Bacteroidales bacterium]|nr:hypothetical protein [Candidatus Colimorpha merdihippi]
MNLSQMQGGFRKNKTSTEQAEGAVIDENQHLEGRTQGTSRRIVNSLTEGNYSGVADEDEIAAVEEPESSAVPLPKNLAFKRADSGTTEPAPAGFDTGTPHTASQIEQAPVDASVRTLSQDNQSGGMLYEEDDEEHNKRKKAANELIEPIAPTVSTANASKSRKMMSKKASYDYAAKHGYRDFLDTNPESSLRYWREFLKQHPEMNSKIRPENLAHKEYGSHWWLTHPTGNWDRDMKHQAGKWLRGEVPHWLDEEGGWTEEQFRDLIAETNAAHSQAKGKKDKPPRPKDLNRFIADEVPVVVGEEGQPLTLADIEGDGLEKPSVAGFATNDANTAYNEDGEALEGQHIPVNNRSAYLDSLPGKSSMTELDLAKWLNETRLGQSDYKQSIDEQIQAKDPEYWAAMAHYYQTGMFEEGQADIVRERKARKDLEYQDAIARDFLFGFLNVEGQKVHYDQKTKSAYSQDIPEVAAARQQFAEFYDLDPMTNRALIDQFVRCALAFSKDADGKMYDGKKDPETPLFKNAYIDAIDCMLASSQSDAWGHPLGMTDMNKEAHRGYKEPRFPVAVMTQEMKEVVARKRGISISELEDELVATNNATRDALVEHVHTTGDIQKLYAWENQVRAMCRLTDSDPVEYGVSLVGEGSVGEEALANLMFADVMGEGYPEAAESAKERTERAKQGILKQRQRAGAVMKDGKLTASKIDSWTGSFVALASTIHILGDIRLLVTGAPEHGVGNLETKMASALLRNGDTRYTKTPYLRELDKDVQHQERIKALQLLFRAGSGFDFVQAFADTRQPWTLQNAQKFILEGSINVESTKVKKAQQFVNDFSEKIQSGAFGLNKLETSTFTDALLGELAFTKGITAQQLEQGFKVNPDKFFSELMLHGEAKQALVMTNNLYAARISPLSETVNDLLRAHGMSNALISIILGSPFITYGVRAFELFTPFSNTISWIVTCKSKNPDLKELQIGGIDEKGWKKALLFDMMKLGQTSLMTAVFAVAIGLSGGIEPPDDPKKYYYPWEWKIHVPWSDEPIPLHQSWFMDDLFQWAAPLSMALCFANQTHDYAGAAKMFSFGFYDIFGTNKVIKCVDALINLPKTIKSIGKYDPSKIMLDKLIYTLDYVTKPMGLYQMQDYLMSDELRRNPNYRLDENGKEVYRDSEFERMFARAADKNDLLALLGNIDSWIHGNGFARYGRNNDGYEHDPDEKLKAIADGNGYEQYLSSNHLEDGELAERMYAEHILDVISQYKDEVDAAEDSFVITPKDAFMVKDALGDRLDALTDREIELRRMKANGEFSGHTDDYWTLLAGVQADKGEIFRALDTLAYDGVVYDSKVYNVEEGTQIEMLGQYDENGNTKRYNYGDKMTWLGWFTSPETDNDYFRDVSATKSGKEGNEGDFRTESFRDDGTTAYQRHDVPNKDSEFVKEFQDEYKAKKEELQKKLDDADLSSNNSSGGNSYGSSSGGGNAYSYSSSGGGSGYSPKIYNMKGGSLSVNKPATMYTKTPYSANKSYLSPDFQTAGSRNAYKRSEY